MQFWFEKKIESDIRIYDFKHVKYNKMIKDVKKMTNKLYNTFKEELITYIS